MDMETLGATLAIVRKWLDERDKETIYDGGDAEDQSYQIIYDGGDASDA